MMWWTLFVLSHVHERHPLRRRIVTRLIDRHAVNTLTEVLRRGNWRAQAAAAEALGDIGDPRTVLALKEGFGSFNFPISEVTKALLKIGDTHAIAALKAALADDPEYVRICVARAL